MKIIRFPLERTRPAMGPIRVVPESRRQVLRFLCSMARSCDSWAHDCVIGPILIKKGEPCVTCGQRESDEPRPPNQPAA